VPRVRRFLFWELQHLSLLMFDAVSRNSRAFAVVVRHNRKKDSRGMRAVVMNRVVCDASFIVCAQRLSSIRIWIIARVV
jgi:hypothetical protein